MPNGNKKRKNEEILQGVENKENNKRYENQLSTSLIQNHVFKKRKTSFFEILNQAALAKIEKIKTLVSPLLSISGTTNLNFKNTLTEIESSSNMLFDSVVLFVNRASQLDKKAENDINTLLKKAETLLTLLYQYKEKLENAKLKEDAETLQSFIQERIEKPKIRLTIAYEKFSQPEEIITNSIQSRTLSNQKK